MTDRPTLRTTSAALGFLALLVAIPYALPERWSAVPLPGGKVIGLRLLHPPPASSVVPDAPEPEVEPTVGEVKVQPAAVVEVEDPTPRKAVPDKLPDVALGDTKGMLIDATGKGLLPLFRALDRVEKKEPGAVARFSYYGDSIIAFDLVTSTLRRKLSDRFGDAGHGFVLPADAWTGYHQYDVARFSSSNWLVSRATGPLSADNFYGLGGVSFRGDEAIALVGTSRVGTYGRNASRFVVSYATDPAGGQLVLKVDGQTLSTVSTQAPTVETRVAEVKVADGAHTFEMRTHKGGVRMFGVEILRDEPGTVVDALGIMSSRLWQLERADAAQWTAEIRRVRPAVLALAIGTNDVSDGVRQAKVFERYDEIARGMVKRWKDAAGDATVCLIVGPLDRGSGPNDPYTNRGVAGRVNATLKSLSLEHGCVFWDVFGFMGGQGSMAVWARSGLGDMDHMHPSPRGAELLATVLFDELMRRYEAWKAEPKAD